MRKLIVDNCSISDFFKFYSFDKDHEKKVFTKIVNFLKEKIASEEIIIIDKVYQEMTVGSWYPEMRDFKREIKKKVVSTQHLLVEVDELIEKYTIEENKRFYENDENRIRVALDEYLDGNADLYLIAFCLELKEKGDQPILITEESKKSDNKLIEKIPIICKEENEDIKCKTIPHSLFEIYREELKFKLNEYFTPLLVL